VSFVILISIYGINAMSTNIDRFIDLHSPVNNDIVATAYKSIEDALFSLGVTSYISLAIIISLIIILLFRFHFSPFSNKKIGAIYIWVLLIILIIALAFSVYTVNELYTNIDSYVNIYISNIKSK